MTRKRQKMIEHSSDTHVAMPSMPQSQWEPETMQKSKTYWVAIQEKDYKGLKGLKGQKGLKVAKPAWTKTEF